MFNAHNSHVWSQLNPHETFVHHHQVRFSVNIWAGIIGDHLIGPYLLPPRLNGKIYKIFLEETLPDLMDDLPLAVRQDMWFQQDGAPAHYTLEVQEFLNKTYPARWIGRGGPVAWPPRSPDLTPLDFFSWGYIKSLIYERIIAACDMVLETPGIFDRIF